MTFEEYEAEVKEHLSQKRFYHSQCVAKEAAKLAKRHGGDPEQARLAGILHDVMKDTDTQEQLKIMNEFGIILTHTQKSNTRPWHAISGAAYVQHMLKVEDMEIISAIACHTTGKKNMSLLDSILFVADNTAADRSYSGVERVRKKARRNLLEAMLEIVSFKLCDLIENGFTVYEESIIAYNSILEMYKAQGIQQPKKIKVSTKK